MWNFPSLMVTKSGVVGWWLELQADEANDAKMIVIAKYSFKMFIMRFMIVLSNAPTQ